MIIIFFLSGLIVGSFLNVVVYRVNLAENLVTGRSYCPHCKNKIRWYDNIPVLSFLILRAQCRDCKGKISWQYPSVEIFTGLMFAAVGVKFFSATDVATWTVTSFYLGVVSFLIAIFVYDWLFLEIPGVVLWPAIGWTIAFNLIFDWSRLNLGSNLLDISTYSGTLAAFAAFMFFFLMVAVSKEKWMGMGDAYLVILLGLIVGWPEILLALMLAFSIGAIIGLALIAFGKKKMDSQVPFGPFLVAGTFIAIFFSTQIINWYSSLFY
jgi:leader peptidase (prepilin peptidase) / N-methyltransferase